MSFSSCLGGGKAPCAFSVDDPGRKLHASSDCRAHMPPRTCMGCSQGAEFVSQSARDRRGYSSIRDIAGQAKAIRNDQRRRPLGKACGASCGRVVTDTARDQRCSYLREASCIGRRARGCGAPLASPSRVIVEHRSPQFGRAGLPAHHICARRRQGRSASGIIDGDVDMIRVVQGLSASIEGGVVETPFRRCDCQMSFAKSFRYCS